MSIQSAPIEVFYSYADADEDLRNELDKHLSQLRRDGLITTWHKRQIVAGQDWTKALDQYLNRASVILLLVSSDFLASDYCYGIEMQRAMERHDAKEAQVIPVLLRPVDWRTAPFFRLAVLPDTGKPITEWSNWDAAFSNIVAGIRRVVEELTRFSEQKLDTVQSLGWDVPYHFSSAEQKADLKEQNKMASERAYKYDIAISYAGEDRSYAEALAYALRLQGLKVFYDHYEKSTLWGKNLYDYLSDLYQHQAHYCIMLLSQYYAAKVWTTHERKAAQNRAVREKEEYILPIRLDNTEIPGHLQTLAYLNWNEETVETITMAILEKMGRISHLPLSSLAMPLLPQQKEERSANIQVEAEQQRMPLKKNISSIVQQEASSALFISPFIVEKPTVLYTFSGHTDSVGSISIGANGQLLVSGSDDKTIKVWELSTGKEVRTLTGHIDAVYSVAISADGQTVVSGSGDNTIKIWNLSTGKEVHTLTDHTDAVYSVAISADGQTVVSGSGDSTIKVWGCS